MQCPTRKEVLSKRYWRPSQWNGYAAETGDYSQCKICDGDMIASWRTSAEQRPPASNSSAMPCPDRDSSGASSPKRFRSTVEHVPKEAHQLIELLLHFKSHKCSDFIYQWMGLPRKVRKLYSYNGAIRCQDNSDPRHYFCKIDDQHYFDPTNWVYALAMRMMMPQMMKDINWNNETKGDIFESILGCQYLVSHGFLKQPMTSLERHIGTVAAIFEAFAWFTHKLCGSVGHGNPESILRWATWILDMVAWRQKRDSAVGTIVVVEDLDDYDFDLEPRTKCHALRIGN